MSIISLFADRVAVRDYAKEKAAANPSFSYTTVSNGPFYDWVRIISATEIHDAVEQC